MIAHSPKELSDRLEALRRSLRDSGKIGTESTENYELVSILNGVAALEGQKRPIREVRERVCDMCRKPIPTKVQQSEWSYDVKSRNSDYSEHWEFCSGLCMVSWLVDDEQVLRIYARRRELIREIKHPHGISRYLRKLKSGFIILEPWGDEKTRLGVPSVRIAPIRFEQLRDEKDAKEAGLTKEEIEAIPSND